MIAKYRSPVRLLSLLVNDTRGATAIILAISMSAMVGLAGLGIETGLWFSEKRQYQTAADAAAVSGAFLLAAADASGTPCYTSGACLTAIRALGKSAANSNGFAASTTPPNTISITQGNWNGSTYTANGSPLNAVKAVITEQKRPLLAAVYSTANVSIGASAIANVVHNFAGGGCVLSLAKTGAGALMFSGNASLNSPGCVTASNSSDACSISTNGSPTLNTADIYTAGSYCIGANTTFSTAGNLVPVTGAAPVPDPFADTFPSNPSMPVSCAGAVNFPNSTSFTPGTYNGVNFNGASTYTFAAGTYYICGNFKASATINTGAGGATFIVQGTIDVTGSGTLAAPSSGTYSGILFYQPGSSSAQQADKINGGSNLILTGAIYLPGGNLTFNGNNASGSTACIEIVAYTTTFSGSSSVTNSGCSADGVAPIAITNIALAQ